MLLNRYGDTALHNAVSCRLGHGDINIVKKLLEMGADKNIKNKQGKKPIDIAQSFGNQEIYNLLA
ncbi:MAG: ankyrin repeat domain-containing protein [Candidatus Babeliaceae bacterium]|jgi:ankyrin repeat protein